MSYTKGPWRYGKNLLDTFTIKTNSNGIHDYIGESERENDARLISAAPDLLDACKALLKFNEELCQDVNVSIHYPSAEKARQAIAKAEGK